MYIRPAAVIRLFTIAIVLLAGGFSLAAPAAAQTAQVRYERTLAREEAARDAAPTLAALRSIAAAYETIVRAYPRSGYADNALWQGAGVLQLAWERGGQARDKEQALRLLQWLRRAPLYGGVAADTDGPPLGALPRFGLVGNSGA